MSNMVKSFVFNYYYLWNGSKVRNPTAIWPVNASTCRICFDALFSFRKIRVRVGSYALMYKLEQSNILYWIQHYYFYQRNCCTVFFFLCVMVLRKCFWISQIAKLQLGPQRKISFGVWEENFDQFISTEIPLFFFLNRDSVNYKLAFGSLCKLCNIFLSRFDQPELFIIVSI